MFGGMTDRVQTTVVFICPGCGQTYQAIQKPQRDDRAGEYNCAPCKTNIHTWSGRYDYDDWQTFGTGTKH
jgi:predicted SprT family Zn-dependent metalloprotease